MFRIVRVSIRHIPYRHTNTSMSLPSRLLIDTGYVSYSRDLQKRNIDFLNIQPPVLHRNKSSLTSSLIANSNNTSPSPSPGTSSMPRDSGNQSLLLQQMFRIANVFNRLEMDQTSVSDSVRNEMEENMAARDAMLADAAKAESETPRSKSAARRQQKQPQRHAQSHQLDDGELPEPGTPEWYR